MGFASMRGSDLLRFECRMLQGAAAADMAEAAGRVCRFRVSGSPEFCCCLPARCSDYNH